MGAAAFFWLLASLKTIYKVSADVSSACDEYGGIYMGGIPQRTVLKWLWYQYISHIAFCNYNEIPLMKAS